MLAPAILADIVIHRFKFAIGYFGNAISAGVGCLDILGLPGNKHDVIAVLVFSTFIANHAANLPAFDGCDRLGCCLLIGAIIPACQDWWCILVEVTGNSRPSPGCFATFESVRVFRKRFSIYRLSRLSQCGTDYLL
jgi:hypothetical protein